MMMCKLANIDFNLFSNAEDKNLFSLLINVGASYDALDS